MIRHRLNLLCFGIALLPACNLLPPILKTDNGEARQAEILSSRGQHDQAAKLYSQLAKNHPAQQNQFYLMAAASFVRKGDHDNAKQYADKIDPTALPEQQRQKLQLLFAQIDLSYGNVEQALNRLQRIRVDQLPNGDRKNFYQSLAFAYSLTGDIIASVKARIHLNDWLIAPQQIDENKTAILETLNLLPRQQLLFNRPPPPDVLGGWMTLAYLLKQPFASHDELMAELSRWRNQYPRHPADGDFLYKYIQKPLLPFTPPASIAVLLPESGPYSEAAKAIREGILTAYNHQLQTTSQPLLRFYDSTQSSPSAVYHKAVANGAELIIGPLSKDNIISLATDIELTVPILALNHVEHLSKPNLYQFGLSPIDVARQIATKAWQDGHRKILLLTPENEQGERIANYLADAWMQTGGSVLEAQTYNPVEHDFSEPIKQILNLNESDRRYRQLRRLLARNIEYTPRRRHDVDAIFINAHTSAARSLNPQLRFYRATDVPVYATPNLYTGVQNPSKDIDLNNITFCDIPGLFPEAHQGTLPRLDLSNSRQQPTSSYLRLIALGIDAYNLTPRLGELPQESYQGTTGNLSLNAENRITRRLVCAKFSNGIAVVSRNAASTLDINQRDTDDIPEPTLNQPTNDVFR